MGLVFHLRCITPRFAFSLVPPCHPFQVTSGSLRVTFHSRLLPVCGLRGAIAGSGSTVCTFPEARISFIPMHAWAWALFLRCCLSNLKMFFAKLFLLTSSFLSLIIRGISPSPSTPVCLFILFYHKMTFWGFSTLLVYEDNLTPVLCWSLLHMLKMKALSIFNVLPLH